MSDSNSFVCTTCGKTHPLDSRDWRCGCGGLFDLETALEGTLEKYQARLAAQGHAGSAHSQGT
jgi:hypothetical protein